MPRCVLHTEQDARDFLRGLILMGTGGGGRPEVGWGYLRELLAEGVTVGWSDPADVPDDAWTCSTFSMGSIAPTTTLSREERARLGYGPAIISRPFLRAVQELSAYVGLEMGAIASFELGAGNTIGPLDAAARLGIPLVDGDYSARAVPELVQTTPALAGVEVWPTAVADPWGNVLIIKEAGSLTLAEALGKSISLVTRRPDPAVPCAHAGFLLQGKRMKQIVVPGTLTRALKVGAAIRQAREQGRDPVLAVATLLEGWVLFEGVVAGKEWASREGYMYGTTTIRGLDGFEGSEMRIWFKNENHVAWRDDVPLALSPDLISVVERDTGEPTTNTSLAKGTRVAVVGTRCDERFRTPRAIEMLGPRHYGLEVEYVPIEERMQACQV